ncbi:hypothetical protein V5O48_013303 [Marasmius crinis-equi]|uniref:Uncharacterized protein n=1 Tax=Marasmius crinis-equi TaxID=585013 RepID=A0ABR3F0G1_9AGAR
MSRLCSMLLNDARKDFGGIDATGRLRIGKRMQANKKWSHPVFDRALVRFKRGWFGTKFIIEDADDFNETEYEKDVVRMDWSGGASRGHKGFSLSQDDIENGLTAQEMMDGLRERGGSWHWHTVETPISGGAAAWDLKAVALMSSKAMSPHHTTTATLTLPTKYHPFDVPLTFFPSTTTKAVRITKRPGASLEKAGASKVPKVVSAPSSTFITNLSLSVPRSPHSKLTWLPVMYTDNGRGPILCLDLNKHRNASAVIPTRGRPLFSFTTSTSTKSQPPVPTQPAPSDTSRFGFSLRPEPEIAIQASESILRVAIESVQILSAEMKQAQQERIREMKAGLHGFVSGAIDEAMREAKAASHALEGRDGEVANARLVKLVEDNLSSMFESTEESIERTVRKAVEGPFNQIHEEIRETWNGFEDSSAGQLAEIRAELEEMRRNMENKNPIQMESRSCPVSVSEHPLAHLLGQISARAHDGSGFGSETDDTGVVQNPSTSSPSIADEVGDIKPMVVGGAAESFEGQDSIVGMRCPIPGEGVSVPGRFRRRAFVTPSG